jgi:hypothetical protein
VNHSEHQPKAEVDPCFEVQLTKVGALKGEPDRQWFLESVRRSQRALAEGRAWADRELQSTLDDD